MVRPITQMRNVMDSVADFFGNVQTIEADGCNAARPTGDVCPCTIYTRTKLASTPKETPHRNRNAARGGTKLPYVPPKVETIYVSQGPPKDVIVEWSGEPAPPPNSTDEDPHDLDA